MILTHMVVISVKHFYKKIESSPNISMVWLTLFLYQFESIAAITKTMQDDYVE